MIDKTDSILGKRIKTVIAEAKLEGPYIPPVFLQHLEDICATLVNGIGLHTDHHSVADTPKRLARMFDQELCYGTNYDNFPKCTLFSAAGHDEIILERNIKVHSMCEHHLVPIIGKAHVAYIPNYHLLGLSKIPRVVDFFSRRPQTQERMTEQISIALRHILETQDVAVIIVAEHFCVKYRGIQDPCSDTVTSSMRGRFRDVPEARNELMSLMHFGS